jgi:hypothetical protein
MLLPLRSAICLVQGVRPFIGHKADADVFRAERLCVWACNHQQAFEAHERLFMIARPNAAKHAPTQKRSAWKMSASTVCLLNGRSQVYQLVCSRTCTVASRDSWSPAAYSWFLRRRAQSGVLMHKAPRQAAASVKNCFVFPTDRLGTTCGVELAHATLSSTYWNC